MSLLFCIFLTKGHPNLTEHDKVMIVLCKPLIKDCCGSMMRRRPGTEGPMACACLAWWLCSTGPHRHVGGAKPCKSWWRSVAKCTEALVGQKRKCTRGGADWLKCRVLVTGSKRAQLLSFYIRSVERDVIGVGAFRGFLGNPKSKYVFKQVENPKFGLLLLFYIN